MKYEEIESSLRKNPKKWLVTGCAGFIGSNLLERLLLLNQTVVGLDNFSTGHSENLLQVKELVSEAQWENFTFIEGDISDLATCNRAVLGVNFVLHQAALGSVPRSIVDPISTNKSNIDGFLNMLLASRDANVESFTYAASSSTYGDHPGLPKREETIGKPLSPYAVTKLVNEIYADVFSRSYGFDCIGLRYFNVFGKRQDPNGAYAAVIPKWIAAMINNDEVTINGDGETSRDFCFIDNVIEANILSATAPKNAKNQVYNVAVGDRTSLNHLFNSIVKILKENKIIYSRSVVFKEFRHGDVRHSQASIEKATSLLGYSPKYKFNDGLEKAMDWYIKSLK